MLAIPELVTLDVDTIVRGQPLAVGWSGSSDAMFFLSISTFDDVAMQSTQLICVPPDTGALTIPATLTQHFPDASLATSITATRVPEVLVEPLDPNLLIRLRARLAATRVAEYVP